MHSRGRGTKEMTGCGDRGAKTDSAQVGAAKLCPGNHWGRGPMGRGATGVRHEGE